MPKTAAKKTPNKSAFIRSLPADMPAVDVVAKAKAANLKLTPAFVYAIRSKSRNKTAGGPGAKRGPKPSTGKQSASEFVRAQPASMKASEVVQAGAKQGIKFSTNLVYAVRSSKRPAGARGGRRGPGRPAASSSGESTFRQLALDLGIARARQVLDGLEAKLRELISG
ncbi:MAG TPA: hypothetical protein VHU80_10805 [Polyangiaceae bacterium]|jgi:hypothetical protein|nr:hypothetical protein [Polyangiaceae bacterium]